MPRFGEMSLTSTGEHVNIDDTAEGIEKKILQIHAKINNKILSCQDIVSVLSVIFFDFKELVEKYTDKAAIIPGMKVFLVIESNKPLAEQEAMKEIGKYNKFTSDHIFLVKKFDDIRKTCGEGRTGVVSSENHLNSKILIEYSDGCNSEVEEIILKILESVEFKLHQLGEKNKSTNTILEIKQKVGEILGEIEGDPNITIGLIKNMLNKLITKDLQ